MEEGAILLGTTDESQYPIMHTRVAGVEMEWTVGILNVNGQEDVKLQEKAVLMVRDRIGGISTGEKTGRAA